ncbi:MAG TPA: DUF2089 domain-containing protein [Gammaproteobacteria bacterium]|nr:DUF2089 domain-containing protein [Gammaproteobacteria bacterium]
MDISKAICPECQSPMGIQRLACPRGHVVMEGEFEVPTLAGLSLEEQLFVTAFLRCHGSIKRMEDLFEISYPTVKNRLNAIVDKLDQALDAPSTDLQILERLEHGEITVEEALSRLRGSAHS